MFGRLERDALKDVPHAKSTRYRVGDLLFSGSHEYVRISVHMKRLVAALALALVTAAPASAHPVPFSYVDVRLNGRTLEATLVAHVFDVGHDLNVNPADRLLDPAVAIAQASAIANLL